MNNSGENINIAITLSHSLTTGIELYAYIADSQHRKALEFSTANNTIQATNPDWKHFAVVLTPPLSVSMIDTYSLELKLRSTDGTYVNIGKSEVVFNVRYSYAGHRMVTASDVLPVYSNTDPRPSSTAIPQSAEVTVASNAFVINGSADGTLSATVEFGIHDYSGLVNKPKINNVELSGNKSASDLGLMGRKTVATSLPESGGLLPGVLYSVGVLTGSISLTLATATSAADEYELTFDTGATPPSLTLPSGVVWHNEVSLAANKHYEINIRGSYGYINEFTIAAQ